MKSAIWSIAPALALALVLALGACGSKAPVSVDTAPGDREQWVCQPAGDRWQCDRAEPSASGAPPTEASESSSSAEGRENEVTEEPEPDAVTAPPPEN